MKHVHKSNSPVSIEAKYRDPLVPDYRGNPFIEALPPLLSQKEVTSSIGYDPPFDSSETDLPTHIRMHCVSRLRTWVHPFPEYIELEDTLARIIRYGYVGRNPMDPSTWRQLHAIGSDQPEHALVLQRHHTTAGMMTLSGLSGIGKTTMAITVLQAYPQVIHHREYQGKKLLHSQIVWLRIECPFDGSLKALCLSFFRAVDDLLGTDYEQQYLRGHTIGAMIAGMEKVAAIHFIGVLVIDEFQNLSIAKGGGDDKMQNYFAKLVNTIGVPIVLIGTYNAVGLFQKTMRNVRRATSHGYFEFKRPSADSPEWRSLVEGIWSYQWLKNPLPLPDRKSDLVYSKWFDENIVYRAHDLTQGITDFLVILFMQAQYRALRAGIEKLDDDLLQETHDEALTLLHPALEALRSGDPDALATFDDLLPASIDLDDLASPMSRLNAKEGRVSASDQGKTPPSKAAKPAKKSVDPEFFDFDQGWVTDPISSDFGENDLRGLKNAADLHTALQEHGHTGNIESLVNDDGK
jgi:hypothetical protein